MWQHVQSSFGFIPEILLVAGVLISQNKQPDADKHVGGESDWLIRQQTGRGTGEQTGGFAPWLVTCFTSQQHASVSQGRISSDNCTCCHTVIAVADRTFFLNQAQFTDIGPTSTSVNPKSPGSLQGNNRSTNFEVTGITRPAKKKNKQTNKQTNKNKNKKTRLVGRVVKASASRAEDPGFESRLRRDFSEVGESYQ